MNQDQNNQNWQNPQPGTQQAPPNYQQMPPPGYQNVPPGGYQPYGGNMMQTDLPGAGAAQVCGIIGIILFFNLIGLILNIVALSKGNAAMNLYQQNPGRYTEASFRKAKAGRTCGIVGLSLLGFAVLIVIMVAIANS